MIVTAKAVTSTTNMTGLRAWMRGSNLRTESTSARLDDVVVPQRGCFTFSHVRSLC